MRANYRFLIYILSTFSQNRLCIRKMALRELYQILMINIRRAISWGGFFDDETINKKFEIFISRSRPLMSI